MPNKPDKSNRRKKKRPDDKDRQILAAKCARPNATLKQLSETTGIPKSTIADRLPRLKDNPEWKSALDRCIRLLEKAVSVYEEILEGDAKTDKLEAAHDIVFGLGVLSKRKDIDLSGGVNIVGINDIESAIGNMPTSEIRKALAEMEASESANDDADADR